MFLRVASFLFLAAGCFGTPLNNHDVPITGYYDHCHGLVCPANTKICKKITTTSQDKTAIEIVIQCLGKNGEILDQRNHRENNPYPKETILKSISVNSFLRIPVNYDTYNQQYKNNYDMSWKPQ